MTVDDESPDGWLASAPIALRISADPAIDVSAATKPG